MKTLMMDGTEEGCKNYLEESGMDTSSDLEFWGHKHLIYTGEPDKFNQMAQLMGIKKIIGQNELMFYIRHEGDSWTIVLRDQKKEFLTKYGENYQIVEN